ncbi:hypothetical protein C5167_025348 [Papaver somniferum]|uniref:FAR1 domain-containing protein n=1 Tax=Papaver somniferum TaxID=3469 RepID=A0A4Y7JUZ2_PAPSO|nr:hypothetical protein C5167_025348 [Papaver somniferum]
MVELEFHGGETVVATESSAGGDSIVCEGDANQEPCEGMVFDSPDAAKAFYDEYARRIGFVTRIVSSRRSERDGSIISRRLACNKEGFNLNSRKIGRVRIRNRESKREGCMAMLLVKREKVGKWIVTKFVKDHSHPLVISTGVKERPTPAEFSKTRLCTSAYVEALQDEKDKRIQELSSELNRANRRLAACREQLQTFMKLVEDHTQRLSGTVNEVVQNIREIESEDQKPQVGEVPPFPNPYPNQPFQS